VVVNKPLAPILDSVHLSLIATALGPKRFVVGNCFHQTCIHMSRHLPPCGLAGQTLAGYPVEVCMVIEQCTHNQPPTWNTASGLELCVSEYTKSVSDTRCLRILAASNTEQQPGITWLDRVIAASTAHHSHGLGSGSTCMGSWQMVTCYLMQ
jgi:hypothetical protein